MRFPTAQLLESYQNLTKAEGLFKLYLISLTWVHLVLILLLGLDTEVFRTPLPDGPQRKNEVSLVEVKV